MKLVSSVPLDEGQREALRAIVPGLEIAASESFMDDEVGQLVDAETDILYAFRVPDDLMDRSPKLRWLQLLGAGCDHLHGTPIMDSEAVVTTASGVHATPMAEYVLGVMLSVYRWLPQAYAAQRERRWLSQLDVARHSRELRRRTVAIVGYGSIGREVARLAKPFGTRILALKRDPTVRADTGYIIEGTGDPEGNIPDAFYGPGDLKEVLAESDMVVVIVPVTSETKRLFGAEEFAAMKPNSHLINIARGSVIDHDALVAALRDGPIGGATLDVTDPEPLPEDSPLWDVPNLAITPHISGASRPHLRRAFEILTQNLERLTRGEPLINTVDRETGY